MLPAIVVGAAVAAACGTGPAADLTGRRNTPNTDPTPATDGGATPEGEGINASGQGAGTGAPTGLPCDVQQVLENRCIGCHLGTTAVALLTYDDLSKPSSDPTKTLAVRSLERMKSTTSPMPPAPAEPPTPAEIATFEKWVSAGAPRGTTCTPTGDAGAPPATNPYDTPLKCTSGQTWTGGNEGSSRMRPGGACITCHAMRGGPAYTIAGTVYPSAHEPNDCNGQAAPVTVVVTDANGKVTNLTTNAVGNFSSRVALAPPFKVKLVSGAKERVMATTLTAGDCNTCHTAAGLNGAPGRVMAP